jgi:hypothetical protein
MLNTKFVTKSVVFGFAVFGFGSAYAQWDVAGALGGSVDATACPALETTITTILSKNVSGAFVCRAADGAKGVPARVGAGTCHSGGSAKSRTGDCTFAGKVADQTIVYSGTCTIGNFEVGADGEPTTKKAAAEGQSAISGLAMQGATTGGGQPVEVPLEAATCTAAAINTAVAKTFK